MHACLLACMLACLLACMHTYIRRYVHAYTYISLHHVCVGSLAMCDNCIGLLLIVCQPLRGWLRDYLAKWQRIVSVATTIRYTALQHSSVVWQVLGWLFSKLLIMWKMPCKDMETSKTLSMRGELFRENICTSAPTTLHSVQRLLKPVSFGLRPSD